MQPSLSPTTLLLPLAAVLLVSAAGYLSFSGESRATVSGEVQGGLRAPEPEPRIETTAVLDRANCEEIEGSEYRSDAERAWYLAHCVVASLTAQLAQPVPTTTRQPSPSPTPAAPTAAPQGEAGPPGACLDPDTSPGAAPTAGCGGSPTATSTRTPVRRPTPTPTPKPGWRD